MKLPRRQFLHLAAGAAALPAISRIARAQAYPLKPVHIIVPGTPGGPTDIIARLIGQRLSGQMGQSFVIENRTGAGGNIATEAVVNAAPDGYTLLLAGVFNSTNASLYRNLSFNFVRDIAPVGGLVRVPLVVEVSASFPSKTISEFIAYAKANPQRINFGTGGIGTLAHVAGELFKMTAGVDIVHVPYRGSTPALTDLIAGHVQVMFDPMPSSIEFIRAGKLRALAVTSAKRSDALPNVATVGETFPEYEASAWYGLGAPKNTPVGIIERLNKEINSALAEPQIRAQFADQGGIVLPGSPDIFGKLIADDTEKWTNVIRAGNIKPE
jgi:tripartite-type tricarboxylate transporter receptor subunit TctC